MNTCLAQLFVFVHFALIQSIALADRETWCKVADPNDSYVNIRYPENEKRVRSVVNGADLWIDVNSAKTDGKGRRWAAMFRNDRSGKHDYILDEFLYDCR